MINIIAAIGKNRELGKKNQLLWHIREDLQRFKKLTLDNAVIMGRKTYESIGKPLPERLNIIITRDQNYQANGCLIADSMEKALVIAKEKAPGKEIFIIGGGQIYQQGIKYADKLYLTLVEGEFDADTFFPDYGNFGKKVFEEKKESEGYKYTFVELIK